MKITDKMNEALNIIKQNGKIIRYDGGFWAKENAELKPLYNGGKITSYYPSDYVGFGTIKALLKRNLIIISKTKKGYMNKEYPIECKIGE